MVMNGIVVNKHVMRKNDDSKPLSEVICCEKHIMNLEPTWTKWELYFGSEDCVVCEVNG